MEVSSNGENPPNQPKFQPFEVLKANGFWGIPLFQENPIYPSGNLT